ncbi:MAG: hypothetical protein JO332_16665 [Planctomycetaceae bacterium]|nr:hypothetical protein [Planctomycetaceae bacterium]
MNEGVAGANYGWDSTHTDGVRALPDFSDPIFNYSHTFGTPMGNCITGGVFYNPTSVQFPATYLNRYFFCDFVSGFIRTTDSGAPGSSEPFLLGASGPVDLQVGPDGALYYLSITGTAGVYRVSYAAPSSGGGPVAGGSGSSSSSSKSSGGGKCGATGLEALLALGLLAIRRRRD